jgi:hypothetical protein
VVRFGRARVTTGVNHEPGDIVVVTKLSYYGDPPQHSLAVVTGIVNEDTFCYRVLPENWEHEVYPAGESATP